MKRKREIFAKGVRGKQPRELDQFFTKPHIAAECLQHIEDFLDDTQIDKEFGTIVEPSFGDGAFVDELLKLNAEKLIFVDIDAQDEQHRKDFLNTDLGLKRAEKNENKCLVVGNPPFGKNSSSAVAFFNKAAEFADMIAFIVPRTFRKSSVHARLHRNFFLKIEKSVQQDGFVFKNEQYNVPCVFQIWTYDAAKKREAEKKVVKCQDFDFVKREDEPNFAIRRVGVYAGRIYTEDLQKWSNMNHFFIRCREKNVLQRMKLLDLENAECKYDTAGMPCISKAELCAMYNNFQEK